MSGPRVSVLLPIHGGEPHLERALASVADQTYGRHDVVAVTHGLDRSTEEVLEGADIPVERVRQTDGEGGLAGALNAGLRCCRGDLVARFDADDVMRPRRLETQVGFLDEHPEVGVVGGGYRRIDASGDGMGTYLPPARDGAIRWQMLTRCAVAHPTVTVRRSLLDGLDEVYRPRFDGAEDYDLWTRLLPETRFANVQEPLIDYRVEGDRKSAREKTTQRRLTATIAHRTIERTVPAVELSRDEVATMIAALHYGEREPGDLRVIGRRYLALLRAYEAREGNGRSWTPRAMAAVRLARAVLRPPVDPRSLPLLLRLLAVHPLYPVGLARHLVRRRVLER